MHNNYPKLTVKTTADLTFVFQGVAGGFYGEGPRGCHDILKAFGFNEKQCKRPFEREEFLVVRRVK